MWHKKHGDNLYSVIEEAIVFRRTVMSPVSFKGTSDQAYRWFRQVYTINEDYFLMWDAAV